MAKNRKYQSAAIRFGPAIKAFLLCALIGGAGVGYVWQKSQIDELGKQIRRREQELNALQDQNKQLKKQLAMMYSQKYLEDRIKILNLGLVPLQGSQIWSLKEPATQAPDPREQQYAAQQAESPVLR